MRPVHANSTQERKSNSILKMTFFVFLFLPCTRYSFLSFIRPVCKAVKLLYWKGNQEKNETIFERVQHIPKFKYLEIIGCIITYSHSSQSITKSWCLVLLPRVLLFNNKITFKDCYS